MSIISGKMCYMMHLFGSILQIPRQQFLLHDERSSFDNSFTDSRLFCSELVATLHQTMGLLPDQPRGLSIIQLSYCSLFIILIYYFSAGNYTPKSFASDFMPWIGASLGEPVFLRCVEESAPLTNQLIKHDDLVDALSETDVAVIVRCVTLGLTEGSKRLNGVISRGYC